MLAHQIVAAFAVAAAIGFMSAVCYLAAWTFDGPHADRSSR